MAAKSTALCLLCRGTKKLCGKAYCPVLVVNNARTLLRPIEGELLEGSTPPSVFVSWVGYPKVKIGPAAPPIVGDTRVYDLPEKWLGISVDQVLEMRLSLVRGMSRIDVRRPSTLDGLREIALSSAPVDVEMKFAKPPKAPPILDSHLSPMGPGGSLERVRVLGNPRIPRPVEKAYGDTDLPAIKAVAYLYASGIPVSSIQKIFSVGALGVGSRRKLVPTRWSITAVDDTISNHILKTVKQFKSFNKVLYFERKYAKNTFTAIIAPGSWSYEWIEAWFPRTTWNKGPTVEVEGDYEGYKGRTTYAVLGGCYYAARLATAEYMLREKRQGTAVLIREIYEGFDVPIGVWFVRENLRALFKTKPERYDTVEEALARLDMATRLPLETWLRTSRLLRRLLSQKSLEAYLKWQ